MDEDDPLYRDLIEGYLTESSDGASALWEIFLILLAIPVILILKTVRWLRGR